MGPNIVLIVADDLGFSDVGCFGGEIPTPNIDALAADGVRFTQFYNTARCSPSRASLLTGLHPHQTGIGVLTRPDLPHGYPGNLDPAVPTIAEALRANGWRTGLFGKWHLASDATTPNASWPTRKGFEEFFGTLAGCSSYFDPQTLTHNESASRAAKDDPSFYYTDAIADRALEWVSAVDTDTPFFLYLAFTAPHWPLHALPEDVDAVSGLFDAGWDELRRQRLERQIEMGLLPADSTLTERDPSQPAWEDAEDQEWQLSRMEAYAAQVVALDRAIGRVREGLRETGRLEDTVIVFLSDNGASAEELPIGTDETFVLKDAALREGTRSGQPVRFGNYPQIVPGAEDTYASYGVPWANMSNSPFRRYKRWVHEGGIATPLIVTWPSGGQQGVIRHDPAQLVDILPTFAEITGVEGLATEGRSLAPALRDGHVEPAPLFWEHTGNAAIRDGRWKLVREFPRGWELYDLETDRTELNDVADAEPEVRDRLAKRWQAWADRVGVLPWDAMIERYTAAGLPPEAAEE